MQLLTFLCDVAIPNRIKFSATESLFDSNKHSLPCSRLIFYFLLNFRFYLLVINILDRF